MIDRKSIETEMESTNTSSPGSLRDMASPSSDEPSLIQYRSKRRCVMEREKKKKKEWWEEDDVLSEEEDLGDIDSDNSDGPRRPKQRKAVLPATLLPPPNRVFMFSTELANRAADAVMQGRVPSIVAYHMAQPQNQPYLRLQRNTPEFMVNRQGGNPYRYGNYPGHMQNMETMFSGARPGPPPMGMGPRFNNMQYQQYLKQQPTLEPRNAMAVDELQQMLFGPTNGTKSMFPPAGIPRSMEDQGGVRPSFGGYPGHMPPGFGQQQMVNIHQERFKFTQPQNFPAQQQQSAQQQGTGNGQPQPDQLPQHDEQKTGQQKPEEQGTKPDQPSEAQQNQEKALPPPTDQQQPLQAPAPQQTAPQLPVLSPGSSLSSSSPLGSSIRSPPPYPARPSELSTLPGASSVGAPSPTNTNSPQTPHGPLTPRLPTSLASPKDGQRSPFSPGVPTSGYMAQQNIRDAGMKLARQSPNLDKSDLQADKGIPSGYNIPGDSRMSGYPGHTTQDLLPQRPNSLSLVRNPSPRGAPPNKSPFLGAGNSPMRMPANLSPMPDTSSSHASKFSVESLTAPNLKEERFYHPRLPMQAANPYAAYPQQPGLYYASNKFLPGMLGQGQYQFPPHLQTAPQQFFPSNMPPQMYPPHGSFPIHHAGNREGGM